MIRDPEELYRLLREGEPHREVYIAQGGGWYVTYGGGEVDYSAVYSLVRSGRIASVYNECPDSGYHVGKTLDVAATQAERKKHRRGKDAPLIYTDGSRELRPARPHR